MDKSLNLIKRIKKIQLKAKDEKFAYFLKDVLAILENQDDTKKHFELYDKVVNDRDVAITLFKNYSIVSNNQNGSFSITCIVRAQKTGHNFKRTINQQSFYLDKNNAFTYIFEDKKHFKNYSLDNKHPKLSLMQSVVDTKNPENHYKTQIDNFFGK